jgi:hypothetical protein
LTDDLLLKPYNALDRATTSIRVSHNQKDLRGKSLDPSSVIARIGQILSSYYLEGILFLLVK